MAESRKLDFLDIFVFHKDEEENGPQEQVEQNIPLVDLTVDSEDETAKTAVNEPIHQAVQQEASVEPGGQSAWVSRTQTQKLKMKSHRKMRLQ